MDEILPVRTDDAKDMARRLASGEALFAGTSSGANVVAAIHLALRLGPDAKVVTLMAELLVESLRKLGGNGHPSLLGVDSPGCRS